MGLQLAMALTGEATEVLGTLGPSYSTDYDALVKALKDRYDPDGRASHHSMALMNVSCRPGQDISTYGHEVRRLAYKAYPGNQLDENILVDIFIKGLPGQDIRRHVYLSRPKTLAEAITLGVNFETIEKPTTPAHKPKQNVMPVQPQNNEMMDTLKAIQELLQSKEKKGKTQKKITCFRCRQQGHMAKECKAVICSLCQKSGHIAADCTAKVAAASESPTPSNPKPLNQ